MLVLSTCMQDGQSEWRNAVNSVNFTLNFKD
jgi:hypothetical protein